MKLVTVLFAVLLPFALMAQEDVIDWSADVSQLEDGSYAFEFTAEIEEGWYVYSQEEAEDGPIPTTISFENASLVNEDVLESGEIEKEYLDDMFGVVIKKFGDEAKFTKIVTANKSSEIEGTLLFMACNDVRCLRPQRKSFVFNTKSETFSWL